MRTYHSILSQPQADKNRRVTTRFILTLAAVLSTFAPHNAFPIEDACDVAYDGCVSVCNSNYPDPFASQDNYHCNYNCTSDWWNCEHPSSGGSIVAPGVNSWIPNANMFSEYIIRTNGTLQKQFLGPGFNFFQSNAQGNVLPLQLSVGQWNGSNFLSTNSVTNVEFFAIPISLLSQYGPSNYAGAPWTDLGPGTQNSTTGLWELTWAPSSNAVSMIMASDTPISASNGIFSISALAMPQLPAPQLAGLEILSNGNITFNLAGPTASNCSVQVSPDLKAWRNALVITNFGGQAQIVDASSSTNQQFYRAITGNTVANESVVYQGLINTTLGNSTVYITNLGSGGQDGLTITGDTNTRPIITNLTSGGQDGLTILAPSDLTPLTVSWLSLDVSNTLPVGAYIKGQLIGTDPAIGIVNGVLGAVTVTKDCASCVGSNYVLSADYSPIGVDSFTVQAYALGTLVGQVTNLTGTALAEVPPPLSIDQIGDIHDGSLSIDFGTNEVNASLGGGTTSVICDRIYVIPQNVSLPSAPTTFQLILSQVPSLTITGETQ